MRVFIIACLLLAMSACKKFSGNDVIVPKQSKPDWVPDHDTIPDHAFFILRLALDSTNYDETAFIFNQNASLTYDFDTDASYLQGFGKVSLASISSDNKDLAIYDLPYHRGLTVGLDVHSKKDGVLSLVLKDKKNIPQDIRILVTDSYANDSLDLCKGSYSFRIIKADTNSFGNRRLSIKLTTEAGQ